MSEENEVVDHREAAIAALSGVVDRGRSTIIIDSIIAAVTESMFDDSKPPEEDRSEYVYPDFKMPEGGSDK